jgi:hypothetical protein
VIGKAATLQVWFDRGAKGGSIATVNVCCVTAAGCCALPVVTCRTAGAGEELNFGNRQDFFKILAGAEHDDACAKTRFRLSEKRTSPFESAGVSA